jgi:hypothetical protein
MQRAFTGAVAILVVLGAASCSRPERGGSDGTDEPPAANAKPVLRLELTNETAEADGPRQTTLDLDVPAGWQTCETFSGAWTQPEGAATLMVVASGFDDGRRSGTYEAHHEGDRFSIDLHPTFADNNVTLSFVLDGPSQGGGEWGHSTFAGYREKGRVRASSAEE